MNYYWLRYIILYNLKMIVLCFKFFGDFFERLKFVLLKLLT